jgi:hypothetical protein
VTNGTAYYVTELFVAVKRFYTGPGGEVRYKNNLTNFLRSIHVVKVALTEGRTLRTV